MKKQDFIKKWIGWVSYVNREKLTIEMESDLDNIILDNKQSSKVEETLQAIDLLPQLEKWIKDSEIQSTIFLEANMPTSQMSANAMAQAYWNVKSLIEENLKK
jgi:hypothetical protein